MTLPKVRITIERLPSANDPDQLVAMLRADIRKRLEGLSANPVDPATAALAQKHIAEALALLPPPATVIRISLEDDECPAS